MKYRKKPVVIEAVQFLPTTKFPTAFGFTDYQIAEDGRLLIKTLEGELRADFGDYIIKGVKGEFYPCKPDIFAMTYEAVAE